MSEPATPGNEASEKPKLQEGPVAGPATSDQARSQEDDPEMNLFRWQQHEVNLAMTRSSFFFIGEAFLVAAYITMVTGSRPAPWLSFLLIVLSFYLNAYWYRISLYHKTHTTDVIRSLMVELKKKGSIWWKVQEARHENSLKIGNMHTQLPMVFICFWSTVLGYQITELWM